MDECPVKDVCPYYQTHGYCPDDCPWQYPEDEEEEVIDEEEEVIDEEVEWEEYKEEEGD